MSALELLHPPADELASFASGQVPEEAAAAISLHLADCAACRTVVDALPDDTMLSLLRKPPAPAGFQDTPTGDHVPLAEAATVSVPVPVAQASWEIPAGLAAHPRYHVLELLGTGGMGAVYKAEHRLMERHVALKVINPGLINRPAMVERFRREVKAVARFSHPNIVTAYDADQAGEAHFLIMEFVEGISLAQHVEQHGPLPVAQACDYIRQAALGLHFAAAHGMVHRDIKPHNLMLQASPDASAPGVVKILDFGLARLVREETAPGAEGDARADVREHAGEPVGPLTEAGTLMGTADFIAPEQANDPRQADSRADIYSLGCTLYYLLAGKVPFPGGTVVDKLAAHLERKPEPLAKGRGDIPAALAGVLDRMMAKDPAQRYPTPGAAADALRPFTAAAAARQRRVRQLVLAAASVAATLLLATVIYIQTDKGEFVIETTDDQVAVMVNDKGVMIRDVAANREYLLKIGRHRLRAGDYRIDVRELPDGVEFSTDAFILKRGANTAVSVTFNNKKAPGYMKDEALRWFPAEATCFLVHNLAVFPEFSQQQLTLIGEVSPHGERFFRFKDLLGTVDRVAFAYVENRHDPNQSRSFLRLTGSLKPPRVLEYFRQEWTGLTIEQTEVNGEQITFISSPQPEGVFGSAIALVGTTDVIFAGSRGHAPKHLEVVRECLAIRAGRGASLPPAHAKALEEIPANAVVFLIGEVPAEVKWHLPALPMLARSAVMSFAGSSDIDFRFRGTFANEANAKLFLAVSNLMKPVFLNAPLVKNNPELSAAVAKAFDTARIDSDGNQITVSMRIPDLARAALMEKIREMSLAEFNAMKAFMPAKKK